MKKFLAIALIAASFVACNEGEKTETTTPNADSAAAVVDSTAAAANATVDSAAKAATATVDSTAKAAVDSIKK